MSVPDYQSLMLPLLKVLEDGEPRRISDCLSIIANNLGLREDELDALLPSGRQTIFENRIRWAKRYLEKAGLLEIPQRGVFKISKRGKDVLDRGLSKITNKVLMEFPEFNFWHKGTKSLTEDNDEIQQNDVDTKSPDEIIQAAYIGLNNQLVAEVLETLYSQDVTPQMFERVIVDLLISMGYGGGRSEMGRAIGRSGDGGIDGVIKEDALGLDVVYIQAKKYKADSTIGRPDIQSFVGSLEGMNATKGVFVTTSSFASTAHEYVQKIHKRIILIDGAELARLMIEHNVGVRPKDVFEIKRLDEDYFGV